MHFIIATVVRLVFMLSLCKAAPPLKSHPWDFEKPKALPTYNGDNQLTTWNPYPHAIDVKPHPLTIKWNMTNDGELIVTYDEYNWPKHAMWCAQFDDDKPPNAWHSHKRQHQATEDCCAWAHRDQGKVTAKYRWGNCRQRWAFTEHPTPYQGVDSHKMGQCCAARGLVAMSDRDPHMEQWDCIYDKYGVETCYLNHINDSGIINALDGVWDPFGDII